MRLQEPPVAAVGAGEAHHFGVEPLDLIGIVGELLLGAATAGQRRGLAFARLQRIVVPPVAFALPAERLVAHPHVADGRECGDLAPQRLDVGVRDLHEIGEEPGGLADTGLKVRELPLGVVQGAGDAADG